MDSDDSEGDPLGLIRPTFIQELRKVLDEYPDDGQILKEMIQNAEDAGATTVKIITDDRELHQDKDEITLKKHPHLQYFKGPALCVYNDAYFTDDDWKGIRMLHTSIKEKDPMKVGRFGLGFKSLFHLTDRLVILSGEKILYMDPFKDEVRYCNLKYLTKVEGKERMEIMLILEGIQTILPKPLEADNFHGTLFWFPIRKQPSDLSQTVYSQRKMKNLMNSFKAESRSILLFLKNIKGIHLFSHVKGQTVKETFNISLQSSSLSQANRNVFIESLKRANGTLPRESISSENNIVIETVDYITHTRDREEWLVVNFHPGMKDVSKELSDLCKDSHLSLQPLVGVALPVSGQRDFRSNIFCFLPLPLEIGSPTGLPVHVNGYFALSQNRRHIKWPTADQQRQHADLEPALLWNCLLVKELLPRAYAMLLSRFKEMCMQKPVTFYNAWPDYSKVSDKWRPLLAPLYRELIATESFYTQARQGSWIRFVDAIIYSFPENMEQAIVDVAVKVYALCNENLVMLPTHIQDSLETLGIKPLLTVSGAYVSSLLHQCVHTLDAKEKLLILRYLLSHHDPELLNNLQLLPRQDGTFGFFVHRRQINDEVYWCSEEMMKLFPGLENKFCTTRELHEIATSCKFTLQEVNESSEYVPILLQESLMKRVRVVSTDDTWIKIVWKFLSKTVPWSINLKTFHDMALLPDTSKSPLTLIPLNGVYVCSFVPGMSRLSKDVDSCLSKLKVVVLPSLPEYVVDHRGVLGHLVQFPTPGGILQALNKINDDHNKRKAAIVTFNVSASRAEKESLISLLSYVELDIDKAKELFQELNLFTAIGENCFVSVKTVSVVAPENLPSVNFPWRFLSCNSVSRRVALKLGAWEISLEKLTEETLKLMGARTHFTPSDVTTFMKFFLGNKVLASNQSLMDLAKEVAFVPVNSGQVKLARDLYDPDCQVLLDLFLYEDKFPQTEFAQPEFLASLRKLGLRKECAVIKDDLIVTAKLIHSIWTGGNSLIATKKSQALWKLLKYNGGTIDVVTLNEISNIPCMLCLQPQEVPDYPDGLPLKSHLWIVKPSEMCSYDFLRLVGSVMPIMPNDTPDLVCNGLEVNSQLTLEMIFEHLRNIVKHFRLTQVHLYQVMLHEIFRCLHEVHETHTTVIQTLKEEPCILIESEERFEVPNIFWIPGKDRRDIDLKPYRFPLCGDMSTFQELLVAAGTYPSQSEKLLLGVLEEIEDKHKQRLISQNDFVTDFQLIKRILDELKILPAGKTGNVIIPIWNGQSSTICFQRATNCTVGKGSWQLLENLMANREEEIYFVHPEISQDTALALGAFNMKDRALIGVEELDFGYGQHEDLTHRLHNLLKDSYTDGLSVPKELIQNADDAGATEVKFLLDERENKDARTNLISEQMASIQGPALWFYNNKTFSDQDFANIVMFGAGTKKSDSTKIGKFGLGFNSVYNLTDVPSFISRHIMAMFDPQVKYLKGAGLKLDFLNSVNRDLLRNMPEIFKPYEGIFGCSLLQGLDVNYDGTLFRFPFRTPEQARESKIKTESYSVENRNTFIKMLLDRAGNLLLFSQNVTKLQVYHIPPNSDGTVHMTCLLSVTKQSQQEVLLPNKSLHGLNIMQFCAAEWPTNVQIKIKEEIDITTDVSAHAKAVCGAKADNNKTHWRVTWASGTDQSAAIAKKCMNHALIPLSAVAVSMQGEQILPLSENPTGHYLSGRLFCFLPLPEETIRLPLRVHVNATFALSSNRRGLFLKLEDDANSFEDDWNCALCADAVCSAYFLLLESLHDSKCFLNGFKDYFDLWPVNDVTLDKYKPNIVGDFYRRLVLGEDKVFPSIRRKEWVSFQDAWFLEPNFRNSSCGNIALFVLDKLWNTHGSLVDIPSNIFLQMQAAGQKKAFSAKVVTQLSFYKDLFFPNISKSYWTNEERDKLVFYALMQDDPDIMKLLCTFRCIPCTNSDCLKLPTELIHPNMKAAKLYIKCDDHFPQGTENAKSKPENTVNFSSRKSLKQLIKLGMITDYLPEDMLLERVQSVRMLFEDYPDLALTLSDNVIEYLSASLDKTFVFRSYSNEARNIMSKTDFLPCLPKPKHWPYQWGSGGGGDSSRLVLSSPSKLVSDKLKNLVACKAEILYLNSKQQNLAESQGVYNWLGVKTEKNPNDITLIKMTVSQLTAIIEHNLENKKTNTKITRNICSDIYSYLTQCCLCSTMTETRNIIFNSLSQVNSIWTGREFVTPSKVAFGCIHDCRPYLYTLENSSYHYKPFFDVIGVKETFTMDDALQCLKTIHSECCGNVLSKDKILLVARVAQLASDTMKGNGQTLQDEDIYLPDQNGILQSVTALCFNDCAWITESDKMKCIHGLIPPETAKDLGVKSKRYMDLTAIADIKDFGQSERLTARIKRLLEGYTCDSSLFKELIQNADDAGATEIKFIKDFRNLKTVRVPPGWEQLQGPSLSVYNNMSFSTDDINGIQKIGESSKGKSMLKTGKYGVGFNSVYHLTDVPSFWTRIDNEKEVVCVFDPNGKYLVASKPDAKGMQFTDIAKVRQDYTDMFSGYLGNAIEMTKPGTLFRLPLRSEEMAKMSQIKSDVVTPKLILDMLDQFKQEIDICLLFLNKVQKIGIYTVADNGTLVTEFEVTKTTDEKCSEKQQAFIQHLRNATEFIKSNRMNLENIIEFESVITITITDTQDRKDKWLVVNRAGFTDYSKVSASLRKEWSKERFQLLPRGGVALKLEGQACNGRNVSSEKHVVFCSLPLPVETKLPVHVNGNFALDHETRRNLWDHKGDALTEWNEKIASQVIVPAYISAINCAKDIWFGQLKPLQDKQYFSCKLTEYQSLFPDIESTPAEFWRDFIKELYWQIAFKELPIFPVVQTKDSSTHEWAPAVKEHGYPGYFNKLSEFFNSLPNKPKPSVTSAKFQNSQPVDHVRTQSHSECTPCAKADEHASDLGSHCDYIEVLPNKLKPSVNLTPASNTKSKNTQTFSKSHYELWPEKKAAQMKNIFKNLNMNVLETPLYIYSSFIKSGVTNVHIISCGSVIQFLKSAGTRNVNGCNLHGLPLPVAKTSLETAANVKHLVHFIHHDASFLESLEGLPLSLRESGNLYTFYAPKNSSEKPIVSNFYNLFPRSSDRFIHRELNQFFQHLTGSMRTMLTELDISALADMLPQSLAEEHFKTGSCCTLDQTLLPNSEWVNKLWTFLQTQMTSIEGLNEVERRKCFQDKLSPLGQWSLIPVKKKVDDEESEFLIPVKDMHSAVFLPTASDFHNPLLLEILKTLPLAFLDMQYLPKDSIATAIVASPNHPAALLNALILIQQNVQLSPKQSHEILCYFSNCLTVLRESFPAERELQDMLKRLPFFMLFDGTLQTVSSGTLTLCLPKYVPHQGLKEWSVKRHAKVILLLEEAVPENILTYLGFTSPSLAQFYYTHMLPSLDFLPRDAIVTHMKIIRDYMQSFSEAERKELIKQLNITPFIESNHCLIKASEFVSDQHPVFKTMRPQEACLPSPYSEKEWRDFMTIAGLVHEVTNDLFVQFAVELQTSDVSGITEDIAHKSDMLVQHLFQMENLVQSGLLNKVRDIRFLRPSQWQSNTDKCVLSKLAEPFSTDRLVSFSESCQERHLHLVWSSSCVVHPGADPVRHNILSANKNQVLEQLGFSENVPIDKVLKHVHNICQSLGGSQGSKQFKVFEGNMELLNNVMMDIYKYLSKNVSETEYDNLKCLPLICDADKQKMLKPESVILDIREEEEIQGHIQKVPTVFGNFFPFFEKLGVAPRVTANHYAQVLLALKKETNESALHVEEMKTVKKAVEGLFRSLKSKTESERALDITELFLPADNECLCLSSELIFIDNQLLKKRLLEQLKERRFFIDFDVLGIHSLQTLDEIKRIPRKYQMSFLSEIVKEVIPDTIKTTASETSSSKSIAAILADPDRVNLLIRHIAHLRHHQIKKIDEVDMETEEGIDGQIRRELTFISLKEVANLHTVLTFNNQEILNSSGNKPSYVDKINEDVRKCTVYLDTGACQEMELNIHIFYRSITEAVQFVLHDVSLDTQLVSYIWSNPQTAESLLDLDSVPKLASECKERRSVFPPPGNFIPLDHHCYLDNSFHDFYYGEHVGFEVYDPQLEILTKAGDPKETAPIFIYAVVLREVATESYEVPLFFKTYNVNLGRKRGKSVVSVTKLYKFIRKGAENQSTAIIQSTLRCNANEEENTDLLSLTDVLKEIRRNLDDAWKLPESKDRMRVVKRLYLKWHPDKNKGNEEFCTRVVHALQRYVDLLNSGNLLLVDDTEDVDLSNDYDQAASPSSLFFESLRRRGQNHEADAYSHEENTDADGNCSGSRNPMPDEGRRWFRQAEADLLAAQESLQKCSQGHNWTCFKCHQAVEKALKAILYYRDSNKHDLHSHELAYLASCTKDTVLQKVASELHGLVGNYLRMRYPDVLEFPRIPADVYTAEQAKRACDLGEEILSRARVILDQGDM